MKPTGIYLHTHSYTRTLDRPLMWVFLCGIKDRRQQEKKGRTRRFLAPEALECFPKSNVKTITAHPNGVCGQVLTRMQACSHTCCMSMHAHTHTHAHTCTSTQWLEPLVFIRSISGTVRAGGWMSSFQISVWPVPVTLEQIQISSDQVCVCVCVWARESELKRGERES